MNFFRITNRVGFKVFRVERCEFGLQFGKNDPIFNEAHKAY